MPVFVCDVLNRRGLPFVAATYKIVMTLYSSLAQILKLWIGFQPIEEWVFVHGRVGAVVVVDCNLQHSQGSFVLSTVSKVPGEEVVHFGIVVNFHL